MRSTLASWVPGRQHDSRVAAGATDPSVLHDLDAFLIRRRASTDLWFFVIRVAFALVVVGYAFANRHLAREEAMAAILGGSGYVFVNLSAYMLSTYNFRQARWVYAASDVVAILLLRHVVQSQGMLGANATMVGLFSLSLLAFVHYSDTRLTGAMAAGVLAGTALTAWLDVFPLLWSVARGGGLELGTLGRPLGSLLLLSYLGSACLITHRLTGRLYAQLLHYSIEQHEHTKVAVVSAIERARREQLEELDQLKQNFITILSHELRTPASVLLSSMQIIEAEQDPERPSHELLGIALETAGQLHRLVEHYTKLAELLVLDNGDLPFRNVRLGEVLQSVHDDGLSDRLRINDPDGVAAYTEPRLLSAALRTLLRRAELLAPAGAAYPITVMVHEDNGKVEITIHDPATHLDWQGMETIDDVFAYSAERAHASAVTGLELVLARYTLRRIGGELRVSSHRRGGTLVACTLPGARTANSSAPLPRPGPQAVPKRPRQPFNLTA